MTMIEKAALALVRAAADHGRQLREVESRTLVDAVLLAIREPDSAVVVAGDEQIIEALNDHSFVFREKTPAHKSWEAMIDHIRSETP